MNGLGPHTWPITSFHKLMLLLPKSGTTGREATLFWVRVSQGRVQGKVQPTRLDPRCCRGEKQYFLKKPFQTQPYWSPTPGVCVLGWEKASLMAKERDANIMFPSELKRPSLLSVGRMLTGLSGSEGLGRVGLLVLYLTLDHVKSF